MLIESCPKIKIFRVVQRSNQFVVLCLEFYHSDFNVGYNVAQATNFAEISWPDTTWSSANSLELQRPYMQSILPVKRILRKEAISLIEKKNDRVLEETKRYSKKLGLPLLRRLSTFFAKQREKRFTL